MTEIKMRMVGVAKALLVTALAAGCVSEDLPQEDRELKKPSQRMQARMRVKALPPSDFLPKHELLVRQSNLFPFHYFYLREPVTSYRYVYIAPPDMSRIKIEKMRDRATAAVLDKIGRNAASLSDFTRKAFEQGFRNAAKTSTDGSCLEVTDRQDMPGTLIVEPAFVRIVPTRAELNVLGMTASFFVVGTDIAASLVSGGSVTMECRVRDAKTGEIVAMYSNTESDPTALLGVTQYSWTASTRINVKEMAANTAAVLSAKDYREVRRKFPIRLTSRMKDATLEKNK